MNPIAIVQDLLDRSFKAALECDYIERDRLMALGQSIMDQEPVRSAVTLEEQPDGSFAPPKQMSLDL